MNTAVLWSERSGLLSVSASGSPTGATSTSATASASASEIFRMIVLVSMSVRKMKVLNLGEESLHLGLHCGVGLIVR